MPITPRSRSAATLENDKRILDAAIAEAYAVGLDELGFGGVVRRADVTTGAMYSRYSDAKDMIAVMWTERLRGPTFQLLGESVLALRTAPGCGREIATRLSKPSKAAVLGIEALIAARRFPELDEVLADDVEEFLREMGISKNAGTDEVERLCGLLGLAVSLGCVMNGFWERETVEWALILDFYAFMLSIARPAERRFKRESSPVPVVVETGTALRDVLINATADVVARSGVGAATVSRIARRAKMTTGAVYTLYDSKDELLLDAMEQMLASAAADISSVVVSGAKTDTVADATAEVFALAVAPERKSWRQFRIETYLAARTDKAVAAVVKRMQRNGLGRYEQIYGEQGMSDETIRLLSRSGQNLPLGFSIVENFVTDLDTIDFLPAAQAMLEVQKLVGR